MDLSIMFIFLEIKNMKTHFFEEKMTKIAVYSEHIRKCSILFISWIAILVIRIRVTRTDLNVNSSAESVFFSEKNISDSYNLRGLSQLVTSPERVQYFAGSCMVLR